MKTSDFILYKNILYLYRKKLETVKEKLEKRFKLLSMFLASLETLRNHLKNICKKNFMDTLDDECYLSQNSLSQNGIFQFLSAGYYHTVVKAWKFEC